MELNHKEVVLLAFTTLLAVAGIMVDDIMMVAGLLATAGLMGCYIITSHRGRGLTFKVVGCLVIFLLTGGAFTRMYSRYEDRTLAAPEGDLISANEPPLPNPCDGPLRPKFSYKMFLGTTIVQTNNLPHVVVMENNNPILRMDNTNNGAVTVSLDVFNEKGEILISIERGHYKISNSVFRKVQNDWSGFTVFDSHNQKVLDLRIVNRYEVRITGSLLYAAGVEIADDHLEFPGHNRWSGGCVSGSGLSDFSINR